MADRLFDGPAAQVVADMAAARGAVWTTFPVEFWKVCPMLTGVLHPCGRSQAVLLRAAAADLLDQPLPVAADYRDAHALRLWADRVEAEAVAQVAA